MTCLPEGEMPSGMQLSQLTCECGYGVFDPFDDD